MVKLEKLTANEIKVADVLFRQARERIMALCPLVLGLRAVDGGPLSNARIVEQLTALMIGLNIRHRVPEGVGIRFTGLD